MLSPLSCTITKTQSFRACYSPSQVCSSTDAVLDAAQKSIFSTLFYSLQSVIEVPVSFCPYTLLRSRLDAGANPKLQNLTVRLGFNYQHP